METNEIDRAKVAEENAKASSEAQRLAYEQQQRDIANGQRPVTAEVADSIGQKLREKFGEDGKKGLPEGGE